MSTVNPQAPFTDPSQPVNQEPPKKKRKFLKWGAIGLVAFIIIGAIAGGGDSDDTATPSEPSTTTTAVEEETSAEPVEEETSAEPVEEETTTEPVEEETSAEPVEEETTEEVEVPREYQNALREAQNYVDLMPFSEAGLYEQLTSEYGGQYPAEAAQYAIENVEVDWNEEAVEAARSYQEVMPMSDAALYDQLVSEYGSQFTPEQAQYAIDNY